MDKTGLSVSKPPEGATVRVRQHGFYEPPSLKIWSPVEAFIRDDRNEHQGHNPGNGADKLLAA